MKEMKTGLRITAGVLLLLLAGLNLYANITTLASMREHIATVQLSLWTSIVSNVLGLLAAILILARRFKGSAVAECLLFGLSVVMTAVSLLQQMRGLSADAMLSYVPVALMNGAARLLGTASSVLIIVGLFLHNRKAKPLLIVAAVLSLLATLVHAGVFLQIGSAQGVEALRSLGMSAGVAVAPTLVAFTAWILLAVYFGAQNEIRKEEV